MRIDGTPRSLNSMEQMIECVFVQKSTCFCPPKNQIVLDDTIFPECQVKPPLVPCDFSFSMHFTNQSTSELALCSMVALHDAIERDTAAKSALTTGCLFLCVSML